MVQPTYDDVNLILRLYEERREPKMREARDWFVRSCKPKTADELFQVAPLGSQENAWFRQVTSYWEMVASFITAGVLNKELFYQSGMELLLCWTRLRPIAPEMRERFGNAKYWKNMESVATEMIAWLDQGNPGAYEAFAKRIG